MHRHLEICMRQALLLPLLAATLASSPTLAQTAPQSIEVRGQAVRTDVRALCPQIDDALHDALVKTVQEVATGATLDVRFQLSGSRIDRVATGPGPAPYQRALKRAVRGLECSADAPAAQTVALRVRFVDPFDRSAARAVALVEAAPAAR
jgi:hypothetical protein